MVHAKRLLLLLLMAIVAVNIWTGAPLLGLWVGSKVAGSQGVTMGAVALVAVVMGVACLFLVRLLGQLTAAYDRVTGRPPQPRQQAPWLRSMRGERRTSETELSRLRASDYVMMGTVVLACMAFEVWFFFLAGSSIGNG